MKKYLVLVITTLFLVGAVQTAGAGWLSALLKGGSKSSKATSTSKALTTTTGKTVARSEAIKGAVGAGVTGLLLGAGMTVNPSEMEQADVEEEIRIAIKNNEPVYYARVCLHPQKQEFYTVPKWAEFCPDGSKPKQGEGIDLTAQN